MSSSPCIAFAANRQIGVDALRLLLDHGVRPIALLLPQGRNVDASTVVALRRLLPDAKCFVGSSFRSAEGISRLRALRLDYLLSVHFPYLIPASVLETARLGALNLHPAYLPFNRGWHTPSWAILDGTPYGATLHWIDEGLDTGDIAFQRRVDVRPDDTADSLYARVLAAELETLKEALPSIVEQRIPRVPQVGAGTTHRKRDLEAMRRLRLHDRMTVAELLQRIRALTTNRDDEAAWVEVDGERYLLQLRIVQDEAYERPALKIHRAA